MQLEVQTDPDPNQPDSYICRLAAAVRQQAKAEGVADGASRRYCLDITFFTSDARPNAAGASLLEYSNLFFDEG
jgi:hypothetical protein